MTVSAFYFDIPGKPVPLQRHRDGGEKIAMNKYTGKICKIRWKYNPQAKLMEELRQFLRLKFPHPPLDEALVLSFVFNISIPKSWSKKNKEAAQKGKLHHIQRPDTSNLVKFYEDCMTGVIYTDDSVIVRSNAYKLWSDTAHTQIWVRTMTDFEKEQKIKELEFEYGLSA